jgi:hypothetical protein
MPNPSRGSIALHHPARRPGLPHRYAIPGGGSASLPTPIFPGILRGDLHKSPGNLALGNTANPPPSDATDTEQKKSTTGRIIFEIGDITELDRKARHTGVRLVMRHFFDQSGKNPVVWDVSARVNGKLGHGAQLLQFADRPKDAPIVHFNGPLSMNLHSTATRVEDKKDMEVYAQVGTPGLGKTFSGSGGVFTSIICESIPEHFQVVGQHRCQPRFSLGF